MNVSEMRKVEGGKVYSCPWGDYSSTNYWSTYGHAIVCAYDHHLYDLPLWMISAGITGGMPYWFK